MNFHAANPFAPPYEDRIDNLEQKIEAGAQFIQTQFCFDLDLLRRFMDAAGRRGLHRRAHIIVGVGTRFGRMSSQMAAL